MDKILYNWWMITKSTKLILCYLWPRASQFAESARNFAPRGSFVHFIKVIFRSGLLFLIGSGLEASTCDRSFSWKSIEKNVGQGKTQKFDYRYYSNGF